MAIILPLSHQTKRRTYQKRTFVCRLEIMQLQGDEHGAWVSQLFIGVHERMEVTRYRSQWWHTGERRWLRFDEVLALDPKTLSLGHPYEWKQNPDNFYTVMIDEPLVDRTCQTQAEMGEAISLFDRFDRGDFGTILMELTL